MLKWAVILLVVSVIAGALGFSGIAAGARKIALILFGVFLALAIIVVLLAWAAGELIF
ncbi:MAG: DUF1328 domain-containing protein [Rhodoplanes sp.]|jgi:uncharacterized membrane protein YtjA (UPF0391 family)